MSETYPRYPMSAERELMIADGHQSSGAEAMILARRLLETRAAALKGVDLLWRIAVVEEEVRRNVADLLARIENATAPRMPTP